VGPHAGANLISRKRLVNVIRAIICWLMVQKVRPK
jgi:hypothetical protein